MWILFKMRNLQARANDGGKDVTHAVNKPIRKAAATLQLAYKYQQSQILLQAQTRRQSNAPALKIILIDPRQVRYSHLHSLVAGTRHPLIAAYCIYSLPTTRRASELKKPSVIL
jgi:hypothetical protein